MTSKKMVVRLDALPYLKRKLEWELSEIDVKINRNARNIREMALNQRLLKDTRHEIGQMLRFLNEREKEGEKKKQSNIKSDEAKEK